MPRAAGRPASTRCWRFVACAIACLAAWLPTSPALAAENIQDPNGMIRLTLTKEYVPSPWMTEYDPTNRAMKKFGYGLSNTLFGWLDLFLEPLEAVSDGHGLWRGLGYGVKDAVQNEFGGMGHLLTFPITRLDLTIPEDGIDVTE